MMNFFVSPFTVLILCFFCVNNTSAQIVKKQSNKIQLIKKLELKTSTSNTKLVKLNPSSIESSKKSTKTEEIKYKQKRQRVYNNLLKKRKTKSYLRNEKK